MPVIGPLNWFQFLTNNNWPTGQLKSLAIDSIITANWRHFADVFDLITELVIELIYNFALLLWRDEKAIVTAY